MTRTQSAVRFVEFLLLEDSYERLSKAAANPLHYLVLLCTRYQVLEQLQSSAAAFVY